VGGAARRQVNSTLKKRTHASAAGGQPLSPEGHYTDNNIHTTDQATPTTPPRVGLRGRQGRAVLRDRELARFLRAASPGVVAKIESKS